jgi:ATP-dependent DNA helicase PIF1
VDLKPIITTHAALQYVSKYASKAEPRSLAYSEVLDKALRNNRPNDPGIKAFQKLLIHTVRERDFSAQETCHIIFQIPLYHCS